MPLKCVIISEPWYEGRAGMERCQGQREGAKENVAPDQEELDPEAEKPDPGIDNGPAGERPVLRADQDAASPNEGEAEKNRAG